MFSSISYIATDAWSGYKSYVDAFRWDTAPIDLRDPIMTMAVPVAAYLIGIYLLNKMIAHPKNAEEARKPEWQPSRLLTYIALLHNLFLSAFSMLMFLGMFRVWWSIFVPDGFNMAICNSGNKYWTGGEASFWMYLFMISKWIEFGDTVLRVLMHKPLIFLHVWHHATVPIHCYLMLYSEWDPAMFGFLFNAFVHIIMYYYYGLVQLKIRVWWKELITLLQIFQFISCFVILGITFYVGDRCDSNERTKWAIGSTLTFYLSYLFLFIEFYIRTYKPKTPKNSNKKKKDL